MLTLALTIFSCVLYVNAQTHIAESTTTSGLLAGLVLFGITGTAAICVMVYTLVKYRKAKYEKDQQLAMEEAAGAEDEEEEEDDDGTSGYGDGAKLVKQKEEEKSNSSENSSKRSTDNVTVKIPRHVRDS
eukprot:TRINITY_DN2126_c0_g1_i1.p1 TRINITY_DN2126_c0_g1~~TRINITY_DN2126_c0_g1_i1.p1  ORF type:complete len:130 (-),score=42.03 TRINITY_DN2126_c0_g1_i1:77-466(-)